LNLLHSGSLVETVWNASAAPYSRGIVITPPSGEDIQNLSKASWIAIGALAAVAVVIIVWAALYYSNNN
jgi:hypothetical protein